MERLADGDVCHFPVACLDERMVRAKRRGRASESSREGCISVSMNNNEQLLRKAAIYGVILLAIVFATLLWKG